MGLMLRRLGGLGSFGGLAVGVFGGLGPLGKGAS